MKALVLGVTALAVRSVAQHQYNARAAGKLSTVSTRTDPVTPSPIPARRKGAERVHFDLYEHIQFEIFERVQFSLLPDPPWTFNITIGNQRQHIGEWGPAKMRDQMSVALKETCGWKNGWGSNTCDSKVWGAYVEYSNDKKEAVTKEKTVAVRISSDYLPEEYGETVQNILIDQIADTFMMATLEDKNCYKWDRKSQVCTWCTPLCSKEPPGDSRGVIVRWCNAPDYVRVAIVDKAGNEKAHMRVDLEFLHTEDQGKKKVDQGKFDCMAIVDAVGQGVRANATHNRLKEATKAVDFQTVVTCPNKEVTGSCPNADCHYKPGLCFKGQKDTGF